MSLPFVPRAVFPTLHSLPRSYFLGHHRTALQDIRKRLAAVDLVIECRDYRVPLTSTNPLFEQSLEGRKRLLVYTKRDLGCTNQSEDDQRESILRKGYSPTDVLFCDFRNSKDVRRILKFCTERYPDAMSFAGMQVLVVGMPNVGKSTLLNALRHVGMNKKKAAATGAQPGITRKILSSVKIFEGEDGEKVYVKDSPGIFVPYMPNPESMLKLALCGSVKDTIISPITVADYLLYHMNKHSPEIYGQYHEPTNDILELLTAVAKKKGKLMSGGEPELEGVAIWLAQAWRNGFLGRFILDEISLEEVARHRQGTTEGPGTSYNQAKKARKQALRIKRTPTD